ncbi:MAG: hypothetical protein JRG90_12540 [Deltaproteobacteria bacterium]|nr:hypothetical protein [Deltaproteobacteria bacterium]
MKTNAILRRLYKLYPSIGAWAIEGLPGGVWSDAQRAKLEAEHYVGPGALDTIFKLFNDTIQNQDDIDFLRSNEVLHALCLVIEAVYNQQPLVEGLFPEETAVDGT